MFFGGGGFGGGGPGGFPFDMGGMGGGGRRGPVDNERYYKLLGVSQSSSDAEIKKAHRKAALQHHPDKGASRGLVEARRRRHQAWHQGMSPPPLPFRRQASARSTCVLLLPFHCSHLQEETRRSLRRLTRPTMC